MTKNIKPREKSEKTGKSKSSVYSHNSPQVSTFYNNGVKKKKSKSSKAAVKTQNGESQKEVSERFRKQLVSRATKSELVLKKFLDDQMVSYQFQKVIWVSVDCEQKFYIADFFFKRYNLIVELDGGYHYTDEQKKADELRTIHLRRSGYFVLRFDNSATQDPKAIYDSIVEFIKEKFNGMQ